MMNQIMEILFLFSLPDRKSTDVFTPYSSKFAFIFCLQQTITRQYTITYINSAAHLSLKTSHYNNLRRLQLLSNAPTQKTLCYQSSCHTTSRCNTIYHPQSHERQKRAFPTNLDRTGINSGTFLQNIREVITSSLT